VYTPPLESAQYNDPTCNLQASTGVLLPATPPSTRLGHSVGLVRFGISLFSGSPSREDRQGVLAGAPGAMAPGQDGAAAPHGVGTVTDVDQLGSLDPLPIVLQNAGTPAGSPAGEAGIAIMGVDVLDPLDDNTGRAGSYGLIAAGEEIIVGAPARPGYNVGLPTLVPASGPGSIHLYYNGYNGVVGDDGLVADKYKWWFHSEFTPSSTAESSEFGASLAKPPVAYGTTVPFFVVGAPGEDAIYVIEPDPTWQVSNTNGIPSTSDPFGGTITRIDGVTDIGASTGDRFGQTLHIRDFDANGLPDLVVATPDATTAGGSTGTLPRSGSVWIIPGTNASPWFDTAAAFEISGTFDPNGVNPTRDDVLAGAQLGFSLTSGLLRGPDEDVVLVAGAPGMGSTSGGVCSFWWPSGFGSPPDLECDGQPFVDSTFGSTGLQLGLAMDAGNLTRHDNRAGDSTDQAFLEELAVTHIGNPADVVKSTATVPGSSGTVKDYDYVLQPGSVAGGTITVFRSTMQDGFRGPRVWNDPSLGSIQNMSSHQITAPSPQAGAVFGDSIMVADLGAVAPFPRLIVGQSGWDQSGVADVGRVHVTAPVAVNGFDDPMAGNYTVVDSNGDARQARLMGTPDGYVLYIPEFQVLIKDNSDSFCSKDSFTGDVVVPILSEPLALTPGGSLTTDIVLRDASGSEVVTLPLTITHSADEITLTFTEPRVGGFDPWRTRDCLPVTPGGSGDFLLTNYQAMACE